MHNNLAILKYPPKLTIGFRQNVVYAHANYHNEFDEIHLDIF